MENEQSIFTAALEKASPAEREAFLAAACGVDSALRARVERLLAADQRAEGILERGHESPFSATALAPDRVFAKHFRLREKLGEGGMGEVWVAEQIEPVQRTVALKVVRSGLDSASMLARFEQERQALALMDHPNIAKVLDAGVSEHGRPFFVMEYISGVAITDYCDSARLSSRDRVELFLSVCQAVQHAHQKGIIHRDLKPSNILVGLYDGRPITKVIDFGVAKATGRRLTDQSVATEVGSLIGTLEYMSPEQAELTNVDIDTRTDIYALGVILYELLAGSVPFSRKQLQSAAFAEILRVIREVDPPKPSTRLSDSRTLPNIAAIRHAEPKKLVGQIRGDLDWIVMRCLEKDRSRRYETANGLGMDLQRYLADEPVVAGPPSARYRLGKFVRRNRGAVTAASIVLLVLIGGIVGTSLGLVNARRQRDVATKAEELASDRLVEVEAEKQRANDERAIAQATTDFLLKDLLEQAYVGNQAFGSAPGTLNPKITVREVLDRANKVIEGKFAGQPLVEATVRLTLSDTYRRLGEYPLAIAHAQRAVELRQARLPEDDADALAARMCLAQAYSLNSQHKEAIALMERVRDVQQQSRGPDDLASLDTLQRLSQTYMRSGRIDDALGLLEQVYANRLRLQYFEHPACLDAAVHLASVYDKSGKRPEAIALLEKVRDVYLKQRDPDEPESLVAQEWLAKCYTKVGRIKEAIVLLERVRDGRVRMLDSDHPATLLTIGNLAKTYLEDGQTNQAIPLFERVANAQTQKLPPGHLSTLITLNDLAKAYDHAGRSAELIRTRQQIVDIVENRYGTGHGQTCASLERLGQALERNGEVDRAIAVYQRAVAGAEKGKINLSLRLDYVAILSRAYEKQKKLDVAEALLRKHLEVAKAEVGTNSIEFADTQANLGRNLVLQKKWIDGEVLLRPSVAILEAKQPDDWSTFSARSVLGESLSGQTKHAEAERLLLQGYEGMAHREPKIPPHERARLTEAVDRLVQLYEAWNKPADAAKWKKELEVRRLNK